MYTGAACVHAYSRHVSMQSSTRASYIMCATSRSSASDRLALYFVLRVWAFDLQNNRVGLSAFACSSTQAFFKIATSSQD